MALLIRTNFIFQRAGSDTVVGEFRRKMTIRDRYVLDLKADRTRAFDRPCVRSIALDWRRGVGGDLRWPHAHAPSNADLAT